MKRFIREAVKYSSRWAVILYDRDHPTRSLSVDGQRIKSLIGAQSVFTALFVLVLAGWAYTRYRNFGLERELHFKNLEMRVLKDDLAASRQMDTGVLSTSQLSGDSLGGAYSYFPGLQGGFTDGSVRLGMSKGELDSEKRELGLEFELVRTTPREGRTDFYWFVVLSGPGIIHTFPSVLRMRNGDLVDFQKGQSLQNVSSSRKISARFQLPLSEAPSDLGAYSLTFFLYDLRGSLVLSERFPVASPAGPLKRVR